MLEIYNESIRDLLATNRTSVQEGAASSKYNIKHDANGNTQVSELTVVDVRSINEVSSLLKRAAQSRLPSMFFSNSMKQPLILSS
jgi:kinesin family protein C1